MIDVSNYVPEWLATNPIVRSVSWFLFTRGVLGDSDTKYWLAFLVALACFGIVVFFASQVSSSPRLFTVLGLLAGALLAHATASFGGRIMYDLDNQKLFIVVDRMDDLGHFLMVFVGAILVRDGGRETYSHRLQVSALTLLSAMVIPHYLYVYWDWKYGEPTYFALAVALACLSFWALAAGARAVSTAARANAEGDPPAAPRWILMPLLVVVAAEIILNITRTAEVVFSPRQAQSTFFVVSFSVGKVLLTLLVCLIVRWRAHHPDKSAIPIP